MAKDRLKNKQRKSAIMRGIKSVRDQKGMNQSDLAQKIGCTQGLISQYESGIAEPPLEILVRICDELGCSMDYLLGRDVDYSATPRGFMLNAFEKLTAAEQTMFVIMLESITLNK